MIQKHMQKSQPVAYRHLHEDGWEYYDAPTGDDCDDCVPLYDHPSPNAPVESIGKLLSDAMAQAVANGANSVSMPDEIVEVAAWLAGLDKER